MVMSAASFSLQINSSVLGFVVFQTVYSGVRRKDGYPSGNELTINL